MDEDTNALEDDAGRSDAQPASKDSHAGADTLMVSDTLPEQDTSQPPVPAACQMDLPKPGEPCTKEDEVRCTNYGVQDWQYRKTTGMCHRPYAVTCSSASPGGPLAWQLTPCPGAKGIPDAPSGPSCGRVVTCVVDAGTPQGCSPLQVKLQGGVSTKSIKFGAKPAPPRQGWLLQHCLTGFAETHRPNGKEACSSGGRAQCLRLQDLKGVGADFVAAAGECGQYLKKGYWFFPTEYCASDPVVCSPKSPNCVMPDSQHPDCKQHFKASCLDPKTGEPFVDPKTGEKRCTKTCAEVGAWGY